ncbi:MAG TPA: glycosyltransferase, partial [Burkholderiaceae bacterium]|nr:glycosyltransferase [Burkholderiaceae bacterium]
MLISVVVATYNRPDALAAVLRSLQKQSDREFEVVVADDGSRNDTAQVVQRAHAAFPVPLTHVWQEDAGFRLAAVRNRATARARGNYLVYLDGDCIVRRNFVRAHRDLAERRWCVTGGRVLLSESFTHQVLASGTAIEDWSVFYAAVAALQGKLNRALSLAHVPLGP